MALAYTHDVTIDKSIEQARLFGSPNLLLMFPKIWEDFVDVKWQKELYDGKTLQKYQLVAKAHLFRVEKAFDPQQTTFRLVGLTPGETYTVAVRAQAADGEWADWRVVDVKTAERTRLTVGRVGADFIHGYIAWGTQGDDSPTYTYLPAAKFQMKVRQKEAVLDAAVAEQELPGTQRELELPGLATNSTFMVQVRAVSEYDDCGAWSPETRFLTLNDLRIRLAELGEDYAVLRWGREEADTLPAEGSDQSVPELLMRLELEPEERERDIDSGVRPRKIADLRFDHSKHAHRFKDLRPGRVYLLHYQHRNQLGDWADWRSFHFVTLSPVAQVEVVCVGQDFIHFTWSREPSTVRFADGVDVRRPEDPTQSEVQAWQVMATDCATNEFTSMDLPPEEHVTKLVSLVPRREYCIRVRARTCYGEWGPPSVERYISTLPPLYARLESRGENWLRVAWDRRERLFPDDITRYHLQLTGVHAPFRLSKYFEPQEQTHTFTGLKPGTEYYITVQACVGIRWSPWSEANLTSTLSPPTVRLSRRGEDFLQVKWACPPGADVPPEDARYQLRVTKLRSFDPLDPTEPASASAPPVELVNEELVGVTTYRLAKLGYKRRYAFYLRLWDVHLGLWGNWAQEVVFSTLDSVITFTDVAETFFEVVWQAEPRIVSKAMDGGNADDLLAPEDVQKYILRISEIREYDQTTEVGKFHFARGCRTHHVVSSLVPNTTYSAQLMTCDSRGTWSPWSAPTYVTTIAPLEVSVLDVGEDYAALAWVRETPVMQSDVVQPDDADMEFNICLTEVTVAAAEQQAGSTLNFTAVGCSEFVLRNLTPRTSYRLQMRSCPLKSRVWGVWSQPLYIRTVDPIEASLDLVGEEYAHVSWLRTKTDPAEVAMPVVVVAGQRQRATVNDAALYQGHRLICGDPEVVEFHLKVYSLARGANPDEPDDQLAGREVHLESFAPNHQLFTRLPRLRPNTAYEVRIRASNRRGEWGPWCAPLAFTTMLPTEIRVTEITTDFVRVAWGKRGRRLTLPGEAPEPEAESDEPAGGLHDPGPGLRGDNQLRVVGRDDTFSKEVTLAPAVRDYCIAGLNVNCCYAFQMRSFIPADDMWGQWGDPIYLAVRTVPVDLLESSQGAMRLRWNNPQAKDLRAKQQFITRIGDGQSVTVTLPGDAIEYVFKDLKPATPYAVHLLLVEQVPQYVPLGGGQPPTARVADAPAGRSEASGAAANLPVVANRHDTFQNATATFVTLHPIRLEVGQLGENFISVRWRREQGFKSGVISMGAMNELEADYEVDLREGPPHPSSLEPGHATPPDGRPLRRVHGTQLSLTALKPGTDYTISVRQVTCIPTHWSEVVAFRTLDKLQVGISDGRSASFRGARPLEEAQEANQRIGEDFMMLSWDHNLHLLPAGTKFQLRIVPMDRHGISLGYEGDLDDVDHLPEGVLLIETTDPFEKVSDLEPDTLYRVNIRSVVQDNGQPRYGYWSDDQFIATLAPMAVKVASVAEEHCQVKWKRRGMARHKGPHNETTTLKNASRYHIRVAKYPTEEGEGEVEAERPGRICTLPDGYFADDSVVVYQQEFGEGDPEFETCTAMVTMLKPNSRYVAQVRACTTGFWGAWSPPVVFCSLLPLVLSVRLIGESACFLEWGRDAMQRDQLQRPGTEGQLQDEADLDETLEEENVAEAQVENFEVHVWTVGKDRHTLTNTVNPMRGKHHLKGLEHNAHYSVTVRALYTTGRWGPLSNQVYFATLPPVEVHVSRISESFVHVRWERLPQERVTNKLRTQYRQQQAEFEVNQAQVHSRLEWLREHIVTSGGSLASPKVASKKPASKGSSRGKAREPKAPEGNNPLSVSQLFDFDEDGMDGFLGSPPAQPHSPVAEYEQEYTELRRLMKEQQEQQKELTRLQQLQLEELERETMYPAGEDVQYEVVITGVVDEALLTKAGLMAAQAGAAAPGGQRPFRFKKTMPQGSQSCKMEGLWPHSNYAVTVRAMFTNGFDVEGLEAAPPSADAGGAAARGEEGAGAAALSALLWGEWAAPAAFTTLKQVTLSVVGAGAAHVCLEWDTGYTPSDNRAQMTAISQFHVRLTEPLPPHTKAHPGLPAPPSLDLHLEDPNLRSYTVTGLESSKAYSVSVRVCYGDDKWGLWSNTVDVVTLNAMAAKLKTISENAVELVVWQDTQPVEGALPAWRPATTEHQLSVNGVPSPSTFHLDVGTSTLLTLGDLGTDTEYRIEVRERDATRQWREWAPLLVLETLPFAPSKPMLAERKGTFVRLSWTLKHNCPSAVYIYCVEMAYLKKKTKKGQPADHEPFQVMGVVYEQSLRIELGTLDLTRCLFRVKAAKEHHSLDGRRVVDDTIVQPTGDLSQFLWGRFSPVAQFRAPSIPDHPTGLRITQLCDSSAVVRWKRPDNYHLHSNLVYKVYLNAAYGERFVCVGQTDGLSFALDSLAPNHHYRVAVTAESNMGVSTGNNTLLFSTRPTAFTEGMDNPLSTAVPPRVPLKPPSSFDWAGQDPLRRALVEAAEQPSRLIAPIVASRHPSLMTPTAAPPVASAILGPRGSTASRLSVAGRRPASAEDVPGSPPEWALAERAGSLGPYTPGSPFLPSLPAGGRAVSQPLPPQVNNYLPADSGFDPSFPEEFYNAAD